MARDYGKKCSGPTAVKRMADGGSVGRPDTEWWGQGSDGGASPVAGVRTAAAPDRTASLSAPPAAPSPSASIAPTERADYSGSMGAMTPMADIPAMPKPKAVPRPKQKAADAAGRTNYSNEGRSRPAPPPQASYSNEGRAPTQLPQTPAQRVMQEIRAIAKGANSKITYKPAEDAPSIYRGLGMANGGIVEGRETYRSKSAMKAHEKAEGPARERMEDARGGAKNYGKK